MEGEQANQNDTRLPICRVHRRRNRCYHSSVSITGRFYPFLLWIYLLTSTRLLPGP